ncbi:hypothetical protein ANANG_G00184390 [Anguilla anguilla]|uniref:Choline transporter-like protein n=1 Tax=Anguilla anguilla TaxID=7936 RepID=A0A9D3M753_ANGAN|nr:hypothetical protein ANANG_G00184390 [Anguilla anguilla]
MGKKSDEDKSEYGDPAQHDPTFNGPIHNRSCTDVICCILFMAAIGGYLVVGIMAWLYGDPRHVLYPRNSTGMFCGLGLNKEKNSVFYFNIIKCATATNIMAAALNGLQCPTTQVCVKQCPTEFWVLSPEFYLPTAQAKDFPRPQYCVPSLNLATTELPIKEIVERELCPFFTIPSSSVLGRCLPSVGSLGKIPGDFILPGMSSPNQTANAIRNATGDLFSGFNAEEVGVRIFEDFASSWPWILIGLLIAMLLSMMFLLLLRFTAAVIIWVLIVGVLAVIAYGDTGFSLPDSFLSEYDCFKTFKIDLTYKEVGFTTNFSVYLQIKDTWLAFLIILSVVEVILLLLLIFLRKRILIAIALIKESSKAVSHMMSSLVYPLITFVLLVVCVAYWGVTALYLATSGDPMYRVVALDSTEAECSSINGTQSCDPLNFNSSAYQRTCPSASCIFIKYNNEGLFQRNLFNLQIYNVLAFLWCVNFVIALGQCTLAGAFASYYWAFHKPSDIPMFPISQSFMRCLRYHVGSLAFGALILTIIQFIRIVLEYLDHKFRAAQNGCARFVMCCLKCCFWCLEKFIKFLNRNAYIMVAIYGKNFCVSAKNAFLLLMRNIIRVVVLDKVTDLLLFFGKLLVVGGVGVLAFFFFSGRIRMPGDTFNAQQLNYYWVPIITVVVGTYLIASGFFSVYNMCVDTLFLCFLEDLERNDGSVEKPYYMSKNLMGILNKKNKVAKSN